MTYTWTLELELDIAVKYCIEFAKQEAVCLNKDGRRDFIHDNIINDGRTAEDVDRNWKEVEEKQI